MSFLLIYFNPRTHRGVRLEKSKREITVKDFNPRTHRGVRPKSLVDILLNDSISIHAPIVGCDYRKSQCK